MAKLSEFEKDTSAGSNVDEGAVRSFKADSEEMSMGLLEVRLLELVGVTPADHALGRRDLDDWLRKQGRALDKLVYTDLLIDIEKICPMKLAEHDILVILDIVPYDHGGALSHPVEEGKNSSAGDAKGLSHPSGYPVDCSGRFGDFVFAVRLDEEVDGCLLVAEGVEDCGAELDEPRLLAERCVTRREAGSLGVVYEDHDPPGVKTAVDQSILETSKDR